MLGLFKLVGFAVVDSKEFPDNIALLRDGEDELWVRSRTLIENDSHRLLHLSTIERCMDTLQYVRMHTDQMSEDQTIVALLGASVFNACGAAIRLIFSGYYQAAGQHVRYIIESGWLIDYLKTDPALVQKWKSTPEENRQKVFAPYKVRNALDERDGFKTKEREKHYKRLCILCGHPTFAGFAMLRPEPTADAHMGPMLVPDLLDALLQELVKCTVVAVNAFIRFFPPTTPQDYRERIQLLESHNAWTKEIFKKDIGEPYLSVLNGLLAELSRLKSTA